MLIDIFNEYYIVILIVLFILYCYFYTNDTLSIPMYCIYIPKREQSIKNFFTNKNLNVTFVQGYDKLGVDIKELHKHKLILPWPYMNEGRVACHTSHLQVIKQFLDTDEDRCIIFEDDLQTKYDINELHNLLKQTIDNIPEDCDILYLGYCWERCNKITPVNPYINKAYAPLCRHAYCINRKAAQLIVDKTSIMYNNGDQMYKDLIINGSINGYLAKHILFEQNRGEYGSELGNNDSLPLCY